ncbi:unnamed protein product [Aphanomyces euteiches]
MASSPNKDACIGSPRLFRSKVVQELIESKEAVDLTPQKCFDVLRALLPSPIISSLCDEIAQYVFFQPESNNSNLELLTYKDLYVGQLASIEDKKQRCQDLQARLKAKIAQNEAASVEIEAFHEKVADHFAQFDEHACLNEIATLKHRQVLREQQCNGMSVLLCQPIRHFFIRTAH